MKTKTCRAIVVLLVLSPVAGAMAAESAHFWRRMARRPGISDEVKAMYLAEAARHEQGRNRRMNQALTEKAERRKRIERRKEMKMPLTVWQQLAIMERLNAMSRCWYWPHHHHHGSTWVRPYYRRDGTYVRGHYRSRH